MLNCHAIVATFLWPVCSAQFKSIIICSILAAYQTIHGVSLPEMLPFINKSGAVQTRESRFFCEILREFLMNSKAIHKFAKSLPSRVKCRLRGCSSMVEQKLPKPLHLVKSHGSCGSEAHESAITTKRHLNQQVTCHHIFDPTSSRKSC